MGPKSVSVRYPVIALGGCAGAGTTGLLSGCERIRPGGQMRRCQMPNRTTGFFFLPFALLIVGSLFPAVSGFCGQSMQGGQPPAQAGASTEDLQKATQNPVASLISV